MRVIYSGSQTVVEGEHRLWTISRGDGVKRPADKKTSCVKALLTAALLTAKQTYSFKKRNANHRHIL